MDDIAYLKAKGGRLLSLVTSMPLQKNCNITHNNLLHHIPPHMYGFSYLDGKGLGQYESYFDKFVIIPQCISQINHLYGMISIILHLENMTKTFGFVIHMLYLEGILDFLRRFSQC